VILVFGLVYFLTGGADPGVAESSGFAALVDGTKLSLEVGTLGRAALPGALAVIASVQRLVVLLLLVLMVSRVVVARQAEALREAREAAGRSLQRIDELEEHLRAQQTASAAAQRSEQLTVGEPAVSA
jgi:hypothetical protein